MSYSIGRSALGVPSPPLSGSQTPTTGTVHREPVTVADNPGLRFASVCVPPRFGLKRRIVPLPPLLVANGNTAATIGDAEPSCLNLPPYTPPFTTHSREKFALIGATVPQCGVMLGAGLLVLTPQPWPASNKRGPASQPMPLIGGKSSEPWQRVPSQPL